MKDRVYYDNSLIKFARYIIDNCGIEAIYNNLFLRDASGKLTFVVKDDSISAEQIAELNKNVADELKKYVANDGYSICNAEDLYDDEIIKIELNDSLKYKCFCNKENKEIDVFYFERRLVGGDWQRFYSSTNGPAKIVFSSIKGGVGRSTSLCVVATALAHSGKRVLCIDLDLEAPGLGNMLLDDQNLPKFGLLDYFVEKTLNNVDADFIVDMVGASWLASGKGRIDVIPAIGNESLSNPGNVLSKISRAYLPHLNNDNIQLTFMDNFKELINEFNSTRYDVILIDSRAGLHETSAAALTGLGAEIFFFGIEQPQTYQGYKLLLASMKESSPALLQSGWFKHVHFVNAKAKLDDLKNETFKSNIELIIQECFHQNEEYELPDNISSLRDTFEVVWSDYDDLDPILTDEDCELSNDIIYVLNDSRYLNFDPISDSDVMSELIYQQTFSHIIDRSKSVLEDSLGEYHD